MGKTNPGKNGLAPQVGLESTALRLTGGVPGHELARAEKMGRCACLPSNAADNALRVDNSVAFSFQPKALRVMENDL